MKRTPAITIFSLIILFSASSLLLAQKGMHAFNRGIKLGDEGKYIKAGNKLVKAYYKGYYPGFEALAYAAFCYNIEGYVSNSTSCINEAELNAGSFIDGYLRLHQGISFSADSTQKRDREALYGALFTIADTDSLWKELELKECLNILVYVSANNYMNTDDPDSAIYMANLGLKYCTDPDLFTIKAEAWLELEQPDSAISAYSNIIALTPDDPSAYCGVGEALQLKKKNEYAMEYFDKALEIDSEYTYALYCKASLLNEHLSISRL